MEFVSTTHTDTVLVEVFCVFEKKKEIDYDTRKSIESKLKMTKKMHSIKGYNNFFKTVFFVEELGKILPANDYTTLMRPEQPKILAK